MPRWKLCIFGLALLAGAATQAMAQDSRQLKVVVVGGLDLSGVWPKLEQAAEAALDLDIVTVLASPKVGIVPVFGLGEADLMLVHGGDEAFSLSAQGLGGALRTWGYNELVFVGPEDDPAGIAGAGSAREALEKIQAGGQPLILFRDAASYQVLFHIMNQAGLVPGDLNFVPDRVNRAQQILQQAARERAYAVVGLIPVALGRLSAPGMKILFRGDPIMLRPYVVITPGPAHPATPAARVDAGRLADFILSPAGQAVLAEDGYAEGVPWIYPASAAPSFVPGFEPAG